MSNSAQTARDNKTMNLNLPTSRLHSKEQVVSDTLKSPNTLKSRSGFTIIELIIAIVIIAILAAISIVAYSGIQNRAEDTKTRSDASNASKQLALIRAKDGAYPVGNTDPGLTLSDGVTVEYNSDGSTFKLTAKTSRQGTKAYCVTNENTTPREGACEGHSGETAGPPVEPEEPEAPTVTYMQDITGSNCPTDRTLAVDARDDHTYWIGQIGSRCWMMTDLAYAGGGNNEHGDVKSIQSSSGFSFTSPRYYAGPSSTATVHPSEPSTSTSGIGQYGYMYNFCAAMGGQSPACRNGNSSSASPSASICPAGWSLPSRSQFNSLTSSVGAGDNAAGSNALRGAWLGQYNGYWWNGFDGQGSEGNYWTSTQYSSPMAYALWIEGGVVTTEHYFEKDSGFAVRCTI